MLYHIYSFTFIYNDIYCLIFILSYTYVHCVCKILFHLILGFFGILGFQGRIHFKFGEYLMYFSFTYIVKRNKCDHL